MNKVVLRKQNRDRVAVRKEKRKGNFFNFTRRQYIQCPEMMTMMMMSNYVVSRQLTLRGE